MSTTYPGNPANISPGVAHSVTIPSDGDDASAASVNSPGPFETLADFASYVALLGAGQPVLNPLAAGMPAVLPLYWGDSAGSDLNGTAHVTLLYSYIFGTGDARNFRCYIRREDGCLIFSQNCYVGSGQSWHADNSAGYASAMYIGAGLYPLANVSATQPAGGGFTFVTKANGLGSSWSDVIPNRTTDQGWTGISAIQDNSGSTGYNFQLGTGPDNSGDYEYPVSGIIGTGGALDFYSSANAIRFHSAPSFMAGLSVPAGQVLSTNSIFATSGNQVTIGPSTGTGNDLKLTGSIIALGDPTTGLGLLALPILGLGSSPTTLVAKSPPLIEQISGGAGGTVTLPSAATQGQIFIIKQLQSGTLQVLPPTGKTLDGFNSATGITISGQYGVLRVFFDGNEFYTW